MQRSAGSAERMAQMGPRFIRDHMPDQHREFFARLPFVVAGAVDPTGGAWATVIPGPPGFVTSPDPRKLDVAQVPDPLDPASAGIFDGAAIGLLGIEPPTRRRNRLNGAVRESGATGFSVDVVHSFGNCPQYIQKRALQVDTVRPDKPAASQHLTAFDAYGRDMIARADTFFVASYVDRDPGGRQVDVSHRGGKSGFVRLSADGVLTIPDFPGNKFFNTLGNIVSNPRVGLVFVDFETGDILQLSGAAQVALDPAERAAFEGAERFWTVNPQTIVLRPRALPLRFTFVEASPMLARTGAWAAD